MAWEQTMGDILSAAGYATAIYGKWHIGDEPGRYPTDHGFDEWYGIPHSYDECLWPDDPLYDPDRDPMSFVVASTKGGPVENLEQLTMEVRRDIDREYLTRADAFIRRSVAAGRPFYVYFNHSMLHLPTVPREEFKGKSGAGDWADCLLEMDADFGTLLDLLDELNIADNTIVVFAGDNGPEDTLPWRGTAGFWDGSYFTGMEGSLRTPCLIRWPGHVAPGRVSNEIVHVTDMFTTLIRWAGCRGAHRSGHRRCGSGRVLPRRPGPVEPAGIPVLERRQALRGQVAELQDGLRRAAPVLRPVTALRQPPHHQPADRSEGTRTRRLPPPAHLGRGPLHPTHRGVPGQREARATHPVWRAAQLHPDGSPGATEVPTSP